MGIMGARKDPEGTQPVRRGSDADKIAGAINLINIVVGNPEGVPLSDAQKEPPPRTA